MSMDVAVSASPSLEIMVLYTPLASYNAYIDLYISMYATKYID